jgi:hypothetical protein
MRIDTNKNRKRNYIEKDVSYIYIFVETSPPYRKSTAKMAVAQWEEWWVEKPYNKITAKMAVAQLGQCPFLSLGA